jgi:flagellar biosynthesis protein FlhF
MGIQIKKFRAQSLQKAIEEVRTELGDDAVILQTETLKDKGLLGRTMVEVTAAIDRQEPVRFHATVGEGTQERRSTQPVETGKSWWKNLLSKRDQTPTRPTAAAPSTRAQLTGARTPAATAPRQTANPMQDSVNQMYAIKTFVEPLQKEVDALKAKMQAPTKATKKRIQDPLELEVQQLRTELSRFILDQRYENLKLPTQYRQLVNFWNSKGLSGNQIFSVLRTMEDESGNFPQNEEDLSTLTKALQNAVQEASVFQKSESRVVVLIGATGVGKTTTLAKMGAYEKIHLKRKIAFVTVDDYKIGGADQMQSYARILEAPFIRSRKDMSLEEQIDLLHADTVYIDTFGISPNDSDKMEMLKAMLDFKNPQMKARLEIHLVIPVGVAPRDVEKTLKGFDVLKPQFLLFTKWDETDNWGGMLSTILESKKPVSLICHGQNVPDDMSVFSSRKFISTVTTMDDVEN